MDERNASTPNPNPAGKGKSFRNTVIRVLPEAIEKYRPSRIRQSGWGFFRTLERVSGQILKAKAAEDNKGYVVDPIYKISAVPFYIPPDCAEEIKSKEGEKT